MKIINLFEETGSFASNKDVAKKLRESIIIPELFSDQEIILDFEGVTGATQSFIHALISDAMRQFGSKKVLDLIKFKSCNDKVKAIVSIVTDYMQASLEN